jgi:D-3-phosphoglycerate dehydrogenase / 2-oxoglutarate reductase
MATNKKKIFITESMSQQGRALLRERDDIEIVEFPNMISAGDFEVMLGEHAPVHGVRSAPPASASRSLRHQRT